MNLTQHQEVIFLDRYSMRDENNKPTETKVEQMWSRVAEAISNDENERQEFYEALQDFKFVPGGRILAGAGTKSEKTFYNCYVIPVETRQRRHNRGINDEWRLFQADDPGADSREAIFDTMATMVDIMSRGGGVGINWSVLRPGGSYLTRISGTSSGPVGWMDVASKAVGEVIQGGSRRGAAMFMINDWHPDVEEFIDAKRVAGKIENANVSVAVSDAFMAAVRENREWALEFPDTRHEAYNTEWDGDLAGWKAKGYPVKEHRRVNAADLWRKLSDAAHASGEPGVVFIDRYNELSTAKGVEKIICVNPCGEQGLGAYSVCNLGSINLAAFVRDGVFDWTSFRGTVRTAIRFLDNVVDKTYYHLPETREQQMKLRRIGLGVMGLADALIMLGMRYGHSDAVNFTETVFNQMAYHAVEESVELAEQHGPAGAWDESMWDRPFLAVYSDMFERKPLRNLFLLTQAPTGTTSALAGVNSGIEPFFALEWTRSDRTGVHKLSAPEGDPAVRVTADQITGKEHLLMQAAAQKYLDSSVSKTVNLPNGATVADVAEVYDLAWDLGCKGLAVYRDGSRNKQVLYRDDPNAKIAELEAKIEELTNKARFQTRRGVGNGTGSENIVWGTPLDLNSVTMVYSAPTEADACPSCGAKKVYVEGCEQCSQCSWAAC